jgi:hypothetical protein
LETYYSVKNYGLVPFAASFKPFMKAYHVDTEFYLPAKGGEEIRLSATLRTAARSGKVKIVVNGIGIGEATAGLSWTSHHWTVDPRYLNRGINTVTIKWPQDVMKRKQKEPTLNQMDNLLRDIYYLFGEIRSFRATAIDDQKFNLNFR